MLCARVRRRAELVAGRDETTCQELRRPGCGATECCSPWYAEFASGRERGGAHELRAGRQRQRHLRRREHGVVGLRHRGGVLGLRVFGRLERLRALSSPHDAARRVPGLCHGRADQAGGRLRGRAHPGRARVPGPLRREPAVRGRAQRGAAAVEAVGGALPSSRTGSLRPTTPSTTRTASSATSTSTGAERPTPRASRRLPGRTATARHTRAARPSSSRCSPTAGTFPSASLPRNTAGAGATSRPGYAGSGRRHRPRGERMSQGARVRRG